jgi:nitrite reductase/ring-hydroxylating ferredoxin subunit
MRKVVCFIAFLVLWACEEPLTSPIPSGTVNLELDLNFADMDLVPALAAKSFTQRRLTTDRLGFGGVLVVNGYSSNGLLQLYAYDLACPHEINRNVRVIPADDGTAHCEKCGSVFDTMYGTGLPEKNSLTKRPLRAYVVRPMGGNRFVVGN